MSKPDAGDAGHYKGYRNRVKVRGRKLIDKMRKMKPKPKAKPIGRKRA